MAEARTALREVFGFEGFRPGQEAVIETLLSGSDALAVMPTGSGKSLCFQIPALVGDGLTVVVSPLVALMRDQVAALRLAGIAADSISSGNDRGENTAAWRRAAAGETRLLYMAPERLMAGRMLEALARLPVRLFAIDEAHCISQWGPAFRPEYADLSRLRELFPGTPILALTATADEVTRADIVEQLFGGKAEQFVLGFDRPNIRLTVEMKRGWKRQLRRFVARHEGESGIVYCLSRKKTEETAALLSEAGVRALPYHAGMDAADREAHQNVFMTEPGVVIVATIAFGMGIDKADVRYVFHTDLPGSVEAYYQEIGRAGRDGAPAEAHMLYGLDDIRMRRRFIEEEDAGPERKRREHQRLDALLGYAGYTRGDHRGTEEAGVPGGAGEEHRADRTGARAVRGPGARRSCARRCGCDGGAGVSARRCAGWQAEDDGGDRRRVRVGRAHHRPAHRARRGGGGDRCGGLHRRRRGPAAHVRDEEVRRLDREEKGDQASGGLYEVCGGVQGVS